MNPTSPLDRRLRVALSGPTAAYGVWCSIGSADIVEILAHVGPDFLVLDRQHGVIGDAAMVELLRAASRTDVTPLVRVARNDPALIGAALDAGADGVIVPMIESAADARAAVDACLYPPAGSRSYGPGRSALVTTGSPTEVNSAICCLPLIETARGAVQAAEICAVPGIAGIMLGMADLAVDLGVAVGATSPPLEILATSVVQSARAAGVPVMIGAADSARIAEHPARMVVATTDVALLRGGLQRALAAIRPGHPDTPEPPTR